MTDGPARMGEAIGREPVRQSELKIARMRSRLV